MKPTFYNFKAISSIPAGLKRKKKTNCNQKEYNLYV